MHRDNEKCYIACVVGVPEIAFTSIEINNLSRPRRSRPIINITATTQAILVSSALTKGKVYVDCTVLYAC